MLLPPASQFQFTPDMRICRLLNGMWQVSGAHGRIDPQAARQNMFDYHDAGFTNWVPQPGPMTRPIVENNVAISLRRMGVETLDLLQFHWWDYEDSAYLEALTHLSHLRDAGRLK